MQPRMTVAHVREGMRADFAEVLFLESARIYRLMASNDRFEQILARLRDAEASGQPVSVLLATANGEIIEDVE
jgi:hypothetical protein